MNHAAEIDTMSARRALMCALASLDKGHLASLDKGHPTADEAWAETAADIIREQHFTAQQQRQLVAPKDGPTNGDIAAVAVSLLVIVSVAVSLLVIVWLVLDSLQALL